jgi:hypothetical protein
MAIYTPRGLKVRLAIDVAFALIARLHPRVDAFAVLKTTEAIECAPATATFIVGMTCFALGIPPVATGVSVAVTALLVYVLDRRFWLALAPLIPIARIYSYISGYGVLLLVAALFGYWETGWAGVAAFLAGKASAALVNYFVEVAWMKRVSEKIVQVFTASERHFFNAYRWHALRIGVSADVNVTTEELQPSNWQPSLILLTLKWPAVTRRFTADDPLPHS